jgi:hypothetical protein
VSTFTARCHLPVTAAQAFAWHAAPGALPRLVAPWSGVRVIEEPAALIRGARARLRIPGPCGLGLEWVARHPEVVPGSHFIDEQAEGPMRSWIHEHRFSDVPGGCILQDAIDWQTHTGSGWLIEPRLARDLPRQFAWRHTRMQEDLARHRAADLPRQRILVSGASGLVGRALVPFLTTGGHEVIRLRRDGHGTHWDPQRGLIDATAFADVDAVIHLAGESVAQRWTGAARSAIRESRISSTRVLAEALARLPRPPRVFIVASGSGAYGDAGEAECPEDAPRGRDFLAEVCRDWEGAADPARLAGIRTVHLRTGMVLAADGGALAAMLPAFRAGLGGRVGSGQQWVPWIGRDDLLHIILAALADARLAGPVNAVAPRAERQASFAATLAAVLHRPAFAPLPSAAVGALFGEMGRSLLLGSCRAVPTRLHATNFRWMHSDLTAALRWELGR